MDKHAYLVMAHDNWEILKKLLRLLDFPANDVFVHLDARAKNHPELDGLCRRAGLYCIRPQKVYWADDSQVEVTLRLMEAARENGPYAYYHLLSGTDLPIKSNAEIHRFFDASGKNFVGIVPTESDYSVRRVKYYHFLTHNPFFRSVKLVKGLDRLLEYAQRIVGIDRLRDSSWSILDGWTWFSVNDGLCQYVLSNRALIQKTFRHAIAGDELFLQTLVFNSPYASTLYDTQDLRRGSMRFIDWERGRPYVWGQAETDYRLLMDSPFMFARKFDERFPDIIDKVFEEIDRRNRL